MPAKDPVVASAIGRARRELSAFAAVPGPVVVACSGGPDSVALLGVLARVVPATGRGLVVAHVDHGLRDAAAAEAEHVAGLAAALGLPARSQRIDVARGPGLAARARQARFAALWAMAEAVGSEVVALGHTATDQAETMLLHLCRGAGLAGLGGMGSIDAAPGRTTGSLWRPLLALDRATVRTMCTALGLAFVDDPTNADDTAPRTRIRHRVLPELRAIRDGVDVALARAAEVVAEADAALADVCARQLASREQVDDAGVSWWHTRDWAALPVAIRHRMIQVVCSRAGVPVDGLPLRTIRSIDDAISRGGAERHAWDLHPRVRLRAARARLWCEPADPTGTVKASGPNH